MARYEPTNDKPGRRISWPVMSKSIDDYFYEVCGSYTQVKDLYPWAIYQAAMEGSPKVTKKHVDGALSAYHKAIDDAEEDFGRRAVAMMEARVVWELREALINAFDDEDQLRNLFFDCARRDQLTLLDTALVAIDAEQWRKRAAVLFAMRSQFEEEMPILVVLLDQLLKRKKKERPKRAAKKKSVSK